MRHTPLLLVLLLLASCDQLQRAVNKPGGVFGPTEKTLRAYHESRWEAVAEAIASDSDTVSLPAEPSVPGALKRIRIEEAYSALAENRSAEEVAWKQLSAQGDLSLQFIGEMIQVLEDYDPEQIIALAPQIDDYSGKQQAALEDWRGLRRELRTKLDSLQSIWDEHWPGNGLDLNLLAEVERIKSERQGELDPARTAALTHYHDNEFARLSRDYLDWDAGEMELSADAHVPADCDGIEQSLKSLEAALVLRHALDMAIERDMDTMNKYTPEGFKDKPLKEISFPDSRYGAHRVKVAVARLELYKMLDAMLTSVLDVKIYDVNHEWQQVWPGNSLENNIFAFAGLSLAPPRLQDPYEGAPLVNSRPGRLSQQDR